METVQVHAGQLTHRITDERIARMIVWLMRNESMIAQMERGRAEFNFAGRESPSVRVALTMHDETHD